MRQPVLHILRDIRIFFFFLSAGRTSRTWPKYRDRFVHDFRELRVLTFHGRHTLRAYPYSAIRCNLTGVARCLGRFKTLAAVRN